jgi:predicted nucleic acid-binding protein
MADMRILLDTNVVLDAVLKREKWLTETLAVLEAHEKGQIEIFLSANSITDVYYIVRRQTDRTVAKASVEWCLATFTIASVTGQTLRTAINLNGKDFEDNVQIACVNELGLDGIVTRDGADFQATGVPVFTPQTLLTELSRRQQT